MIFRIKTTSVVVVLAVNAILVTASIEAGTLEGVGGIPVLGGTFHPTLSLSQLYDDNVLKQDQHDKGSFLTITSPRAFFDFDQQFSKYTVDLGVEHGYFSHSNNDNYVDAHAKTEASFFPTEMLTFYASLGYQKEHEARGSGVLTGPLANSFNKPSKYRLWQAEGLVKYGLDQVGAPRVEFGYTHTDRRYENNRLLTRFQDRQIDSMNGTFFYKVMPNTSLLLEAGGGRFDYQRGPLDSTQYQVMAGLTWQATYQTEGFLKVGWGQKLFDAQGQDSDSIVAWQIGVNWDPFSYSSYSLKASRGFEEANGLGSSVDSQRVNIAWTHSWFSYLSTTVSAAYINNDYANSGREDDDFEFKGELTYAARQWLVLGAGVTRIQRSSSLKNNDYEANIVGVDVTVGL